jgi:hypothetical protein
MATDDIFPSKYGDFFHFFLKGIFLQFALVSFLSPQRENSLQKINALLKTFVMWLKWQALCDAAETI